MKNLLSRAWAMIAVLYVISALGTSQAFCGDEKNVESAPRKIYCTTYPMYLFARNVMKDAPQQPELLLPANLGCPHDYVVTPQELKRISGEGIYLIANGMGLDDAVCRMLQKANPSLRVFYAGGASPLKFDGAHGEEEKDEAEHQCDAGKEHVCPHHHEENAHLFASPKRAAELVHSLGEELAKRDPSNAALYRKNAAAYEKCLLALAREISEAVKMFRCKTIAVQHDVFELLAQDAGLQVSAVLQVEPGTNPSASELIHLIDTIRKSKTGCIAAEPQYSADIAKTIGREAKVPVIQLDPVANGKLDVPLDHYETTMRANLSVMKKALE